MLFDNFLTEYSWINTELFDSILKKEIQKFKLMKFNLESVTQAGENYSSQLIRAKVFYCLFDTDTTSDLLTKSFVIKASLGQKLVRSRDVFAKEIFVFTVIIPKVERLYGEHELKFAPKIYTSNLASSYLVLQDLNQDGYTNIDRKLGLNYNQLSVCLEKLAKWHACTAKLVEQNFNSHELYNLYLEPHVSPTGSKHYRNLFENAVSSCIDLFQNHAELHSIAEKLNQLKSQVFDKCCAAVFRNENNFNVLNHGDLWSNNIMFKCDQNDENVLDLLFVDFQVGYWGSPILDLTYLLFTSSNDKMTSNEWNQLIEFYFEHLLQTLDQLKYRLPYPSKIELMAEFHERGIYGAAFSLFSVPMRLMDNVENSMIIKFMDKSKDGENFRAKLFSKPETVALLKNLLIYFNDNGFLE